MTDSFGKLTLIFPNGIEQEFTLGKTGVTLGRGLTNDIVLTDTRVSRTHASLECGQAGCTLIDLGSANGTLVNGNRVTRTALSPGDIITLGGSTLRFSVAPAQVESNVTIIDSESELDATLAHATLSMSLNDTSQARLVVFSPQGTWEVPIEDALNIGRQPGNDVVIDHERTSRQHARLERRGKAYILRDLGSTNGTLMGEERINEHVLSNGDTFRIGNAQLVFKDGFSAEQMTIADGTFSNRQALRRPVVFVPGMMGSELWLGNEQIWPNVKYLFKNPEIYRLSDDVPIEARDLVGEVVIVPNLIKLEKYRRLGDYLVEELGYTRGVDLLEFGYDWRQDVRRSSQKLTQAIEDWGVNLPITLIGHSLGTLVSRYYVEHLGGKKKVERLLLLGGPHQGAPKAATSMLMGPNILPFGLMGERLRQVLATFPSSFQILPDYPCAVDQHGNEINMLVDESWLPDAHRPLLRMARQFRKELGRKSSVPTLSVFGYGIKTILRIITRRDPQGAWQDVKFDIGTGGDASVPESSAVLGGTEIHPVRQYHGALYNDNDVKMRLKLELTR
jgi:pSer/pThr/pTyr-binding forkhead associated (FHA) protein